MRVSVIGAGSWGTAVAGLLGNKTSPVQIWARRSEVVDSINSNHTNPDYLVGYKLPKTVTATNNLSQAVAGSEALVLVTTSSYVREVCQKINPYIERSLPIVILSKGIEGSSGLLLSEVAAEVLGNPSRIANLSGPNHAEEVSQGMPSAAVVASKNQETARFFQDLFHSPMFRVYVSDDEIGVQICAAAKNIIAIVVGISYGSGFGDNTAAVLMTRGQAEIARLVSALGGDPKTAMGLAGMGDLIATCTSEHSRNRMFGYYFAQGVSLKEYESQRKMVVEGAKACKSILNLAEKNQVDMPITKALDQLLDKKMDVHDAAKVLLERLVGTEFYGI